MKILQVTTETGLHLPGVGMLPVTIEPKATKCANIQFDEHPAGVKILLNGKQAIIPWSQIKIVVCGE